MGALRSNRIFAHATIAAYVAALMVPVLRRSLSLGDQSDFIAHIETAEQFSRTHQLPELHFLFHISGAAVHWLTGCGIAMGCVVVALLACLATAALVLELFMQSTLEVRNSGRGAILAVLLTAAVMLVAPLHRLVGPQFISGFLGFFFGNLYHSPTFIMVRPFALAAVVCVGLAFQRAWSLRSPMVWCASAMTCLSVVAKPSFALAFLPAVALWVLLDRQRRRSLGAWLIAITVATPAALALATQFFQYGSDSSKNVMRFQPFRLTIPDTALEIVQKQGASMLFPIGVFVMFPSHVRKSPLLSLSWLTWIIGWCLAMGFVEDGPRLLHYNFFWSVQIATFCLMVSSITILPRQLLDPSQRSRSFIAFGILLVQVIAGIPLWLWYAFGIAL